MFLSMFLLIVKDLIIATEQSLLATGERHLPHRYNNNDCRGQKAAL